MDNQSGAINELSSSEARIKELEAENAKLTSIISNCRKCHKNSMKGVLVCNSLVNQNQPASERAPLPLTKEAIMSLNNYTVTFEHARSLFDVDLQTFKEKLFEFNILVWNEANGLPVRIHGGDYRIYIFINKLHTFYPVEGTDTYSYVRRLLEHDLHLSPGYKLTYEKPPAPVKTLVSPGRHIVTHEQPQTSIYNSLKTDLDWHYAVEYSKVRNYHVRLNLKSDDAHIASYMNAYDEDFPTESDDEEFPTESDDEECSTESDDEPYDD